MSGREKEFKLMDVAGFSVYWDRELVGDEGGDKLAVSGRGEGGGGERGIVGDEKGRGEEGEGDGGKGVTTALEYIFLFYTLFSCQCSCLFSSRRLP